jgi:hypothetical protein
MAGNTHIQFNNVEQHDPSVVWEQLARENGSLRAIIADLLIKNQKLRWELSGLCRGPAQDPRLLTASEGRP